ncbi:hypothetical protein TIFTF001_031004 [Ficus carica]|uniref:Uncharacterized protein n=1 Tax=Ficus carica TaxID=3494 RepID=A0AA88DU30_FICCA|nr:hypothetical protein TIFTF001_031004 [Ficus carica]
MKANVRPPGLDADDSTICHSRRTRIPDQILPSHQGERRTGLDCAPSTLPREMYPGLAGAPLTCYCNTSRCHPPPPTLTEAAPASASDGHPTISCTGRRSSAGRQRCQMSIRSRTICVPPGSTGIAVHVGSTRDRAVSKALLLSLRLTPELRRMGDALAATDHLRRTTGCGRRWHSVMPRPHLAWCVLAFSRSGRADEVQLGNTPPTALCSREVDGKGDRLHREPPSPPRRGCETPHGAQRGTSGPATRPLAGLDGLSGRGGALGALGVFLAGRAGLAGRPLGRVPPINREVNHWRSRAAPSCPRLIGVTGSLGEGTSEISDRWSGVLSLGTVASPIDNELVLEIGLELPVTPVLSDKMSFSESDKSLILKIIKKNYLPSRVFSVLVFEATSLGSPRQGSSEKSGSGYRGDDSASRQSRLGFEIQNLKCCSAFPPITARHVTIADAWHMNEQTSPRT